MVGTETPNASRTDFECVRCGERLTGQEDTCSDPLCDGDTRRVATGRE
jgi:Zn finger protein HypA/HybF involved in hydrogenase expression